MIIKKFNEYDFDYEMADDFIQSFDKMIIESRDYNYRKVFSDLKLNVRLILTFGSGIGALYPIVEKLLKNSSFEVTTESVILLSVAAITIVFIEEKKFKTLAEAEELTKDSKSMLEELKLMGIGNGIVKKVMKVLTSIKNVFLIISRHLTAVVTDIIDMFAYTSLLIPIMNGISYIIGKYELNLDTLVMNFIGLGIGVTTIIAKHGISEILKRINVKLPFDKNKIADDIETNTIQKFDIFDHEKDKEPDVLIKEKK